MKEQLLKVGTKVFDIRFGWGEIVDNNYNKSHQYKSKYSLNREGLYTYSGSENKADINLILSLTEYDLVNGGFTPLSDYNKPKVGDFGYFWDNEEVNESKRIVYSILSDIDKNYFDGENGLWQNFSKEIPEWFKNKMNEKNID